MRHGDQIRKNLVLRDRLVRAVRKFFQEEGFIETATPTLVPCPGMEPHLVGFKTVWTGPDGAWRRPFYLPTSPEFHLKKMLALGYERIFEIARTFRDNEYSAHHQPEFTMLEWYRAYAGYERIMEDVERLVAFAAKEVLGQTTLPYRAHQVRLDPPWKRISVRELFVESFGIDLAEVVKPGDLARLAQARGYSYIRSDESFDDVFFKLFLTEVELKLGWDQPVILYDYPIEMAALARRKSSAPRFAERFEVYLCGVELANAFGELTNAGEQARRFQQFAEEARKTRGFAYEPDEEFLDALRFGIPPSAGIALGLDRLAMLLANETALDAVLAFPHVTLVEEELGD
ncbi:MAG: EF-P lysine aminoacylase GenX [Myxococcales bacterium]|nr:MAG: EF-P lysine aminoacylase GenX [Myxococcales bacterium]